MSTASVNPSVVVFGPQGCGKTRHARALARHFGLRKVADDWTGELPPTGRFDTLFLMQQRPAEVDGDTARRVYPFGVAMKLAGLS